MNILAIETSCDETSIAIITSSHKKTPKLVAQTISSQMRTHQKFGGIVPEIASRMHTEIIHHLLTKTLKESQLTFQDITHIAVTEKPGLEGSLLIGLTVAKTLATLLKIPLIPINHLDGHTYAHFLEETPPEFPFVSLIASGGHTQLLYIEDHGKQTLMGETRDDAAGEAFDKIARHLGLTYPGGPQIEKHAQNGNPLAYTFPLPMIHHGLEFSFSGLKTAVIQNIQATQENLPDICASVQHTITQILLQKSLKACAEKDCTTLCIAGGVTANKPLINTFKSTCESKNITFYAPPLSLCTDNAAMIGAAAFYTL
jgi:N6-L-threonylcarbamoyladenine synthase